MFKLFKLNKSWIYVFLMKYQDCIKYVVVPKGDKKAAKEHHYELEHDIVASGGDTVHFITGWHIPEEIPDPILG